MLGPISLIRRVSTLAFVAKSSSSSSSSTSSSSLSPFLASSSTASSWASTSAPAAAVVGDSTSHLFQQRHHQQHHHRRGFHSSATRLYSAAAGGNPSTQFLLRYDYVEDVLEKRGPYRQGHLDLAQKLIDDGLCLSGGPTGQVDMDVPTGALFIFTTADAAEQFVQGDPYVSNGIVTGHSIEQWNVVVQK
eukprot:CAMPEP_0113466054 /NCGR_PEP_ID=MMETSP0014_2-20120614/14066_1 /TAXON_ID=2857 /ORGANISM="Nitzschia sp." /LENGTH=189 /DNA_ID=CAMNT_0000358249 /DNA_START=40 /DNA_END=609 /DNA_ORIENTATION=- /assembly_acc=CAM_ASM_000159